MKHVNVKHVNTPTYTSKEFPAPCGCKVRFDNDGLVRMKQCDLHSAAKELLEACRNAIHDCERLLSLLETHTRRSFKGGDFESNLRTLRTVVGKAEGRTL